MAGTVGIDTLGGTCVSEYNSFNAPDRVKVDPSEERADGGKLCHPYPARYVTKLTVHVP